MVVFPTLCFPDLGFEVGTKAVIILDLAAALATTFPALGFEVGTPVQPTTNVSGFSTQASYQIHVASSEILYHNCALPLLALRSIWI